MAANAGNLFVATTGILWVQDAGSTVTLPVDETTAPSVGFSDVGHYSEKGVILKPSWTSKDIKTTQSGGYPARTSITERMLLLEVELMEEINAKVLPIIFGGGTYTAGTGIKYTFIPPAVGTVDERALIFDAVDGVRKQRVVIPRAIAKSVSDLIFFREDAIFVKVSFQVLFPLTGTNPWTIYGG